ncbi:transporter substrate-binding domain-containing protein [Mesorhizobium sp. M1050]|uniref:transporter substrate-binding domain-containing protein n=1 Tax=Mesorhizobium sp. M1050 TaxID=2957051 RepID=UPI00333A0564
MCKLITMIAAAASLTVASLTSSATANAGAVLDKVLATKTLTVAAGTNWGKMSFLNDKHEFDGFDVEVAKGVAQHLGVQIKFVTPSWDIVAAGKWQGRWDMTIGMTPTKARTELFDFPALYAYQPAVAVVHKDSKATKLSDLDGKVVGATANSTLLAYVNHSLIPDWIGAKPIQFQFTPGEVKAYDTSTVAFDDLRLGDGVRLDAVVTDKTIALDAIGASYPLKLLGGTLFTSPSALVIELGDKELSDRIAAAIKGMRDNGTISKLSIKWYGVDYSVEQ